MAVPNPMGRDWNSGLVGACRVVQTDRTQDGRIRKQRRPCQPLKESQGFCILSIRDYDHRKEGVQRKGRTKN